MIRTFNLSRAKSCLAGALVLILLVFGRPALPARAVEGTVITLAGQRIVGSSIVVADFNGDHRLEIVAAGLDGIVYVIDGATRAVIWQRQMADYIPGYTTTRIKSGLAVADLNRDGRLELVVATGDDPNYHQVGAVLVFTYVGGSARFSLAPGWPRLAFDEQGAVPNPSYPDGVPDGFEATPALGDLDGDGDLEIVIIGSDRRLHAWHHDGSYVQGWPIGRERSIWRGGASSPALADIDKDGLPEIIVGTYSYTIPGCPNPYVFLALNGDGSLVPGFPVYTTQNISSSPAIGDINGDGWLDIVVGTGGYSESCPLIGSFPDGRKVYAWDHRGQPLPGWPIRTVGNMGGSPALADLNNDGKPEVVIGCGLDSELVNPECRLLYAWHGNGASVAGFPVNPANRALPFTPIVADIDGDSQVEIMVVGLGSTGITLVERNGQVSPDKSRNTASALYTTPVVADIDGDGLLETIIGGGNQAGRATIHIWQETGPACGMLAWPMFQRNIARTGLYTPSFILPRLVAPPEIRLLHQRGAAAVKTQAVSLQIQGSCPVQWQVSHAIPGLQVTPPAGTLARQAWLTLSLNTTGYAQNTWHRLGNLTISGSFDGRPVAASPQTVPVWLYTGDITILNFPFVGRGP